MTFQEKQTEDVESEQIRTGQACAQKSAHAPEKRKKKSSYWHLLQENRESYAHQPSVKIIDSNERKDDYEFIQRA